MKNNNVSRFNTMNTDKNFKHNEYHKNACDSIKKMRKDFMNNKTSNREEHKTSCNEKARIDFKNKLNGGSINGFFDWLINNQNISNVSNMTEELIKKFYQDTNNSEINFSHKNSDNKNTSEEYEHPLFKAYREILKKQKEEECSCSCKSKESEKKSQKKEESKSDEQHFSDFINELNDTIKHLEERAKKELDLSNEDIANIEKSVEDEVKNMSKEERDSLRNYFVNRMIGTYPFDDCFFPFTDVFPPRHLIRHRDFPSFFLF